MKPLTIVAAILLAVVFVTSEAVMQPTASERASLYGVFAVAALATLAIGMWLRSETRRSRSVGTAFMLIAVASAVVTAATVGLSAVTMFINAHDLRLVLAALLLGVGLGLALAVTVARSITDDLDRLADTVDHVSDGDLAARTGIERADEVGQVARAVDTMIGQLAEADARRDADEMARRDFLAAVSHDLRTPLAAMTAAIEALEDGLTEDPAHLYKAMSADIDGMTRLVDDLATLATVEAGGITPEVIDVAELVDETVEALGVLAHARGVALVGRSDGDVVLVADPGAMTRVLRNLVTNAIEHSPQGGTVAITVAPVDHGVVTSIVDEGDGFPADFRDLAFDRFTRADRSRGGSGSGLGLAIARGIVRAHGGSIWIGDGPGGRVAFSIPRVDGAALASPNAGDRRGDLAYGARSMRNTEPPSDTT
jgi:signal transduction histidine kinase